MSKWEQLPARGSPPSSRSSHVIAACGNKIYMFGGEAQPRIPVDNATYCYDLTTGTWEAVATQGDAPCARMGHAGTAIGSKLYVFGGRCGIEMGEGSMNDLHCLDTNTLTWSRVEPAAGTPPALRSYHTAAAAGGKLYVFGGCGKEGRMNDLHCFDPETLTWQQLPSSDAIKGRGGSCLVGASDKLYIIAGFCGHELNDAHVFDLKTSQWQCGGPHANGSATATAATGDGADTAACGCPATSQAGEDKPAARSVFGCGVHNCGGHAHGGAGEAACGHDGHIVMFGGEVDPSSQGHAGAGHFSSEVWCTDAHTFAWHRLQPAGDGPCPRGWFASCVADGALIVHGGLNVQNERLGDMWRLAL